MEDRTFIEWDKDDIDALGLMKVDVLALGMLSCLRAGSICCKQPLRRGSLTLADHPAGRRGRSTRCCRAPIRSACSRSRAGRRCRCCRGSSRECFYDLVIEVAIVRPGPDPGRHGASLPAPARRHRSRSTIPRPIPRMASRRAGEGAETHAGRAAVPGAGDADRHRRPPGFTPDEADGLRRAMATFRHNGTIHLFREKFIAGMTRRGYERDFAERCFSQIEGFGEYGFPESHAASFALLVYVSAWIKCHYPDVFCAAILNSQPMGFYQPAQLVRDAREHGVEVRAGRRQLQRLGLHAGAGARPAAASLRRAARLPPDPGPERGGAGEAHRGARQRLCQHRAAGGGRRRLALHHRAPGRGRCLPLARPRPPRRAVGGAAARCDRRARRARRRQRRRRPHRLPLLAPHMGDELFPEPEVALPAMPLSEHVAEDYVATGLSLKAHPVTLLPRAADAARRHAPTPSIAARRCRRTSASRSPASC